MSRIAKEINEKLEQAKEEVIIIGGDFNARIGREGKLYGGELEKEQEKRKSKDKVTNGFDKIENFQVGSRIDSDHQPLNVTVKTKGGNKVEENEQKIREKVYWKPEKVAEAGNSGKRKYGDKENTSEEMDNRTEILVGQGMYQRKKKSGEMIQKWRQGKIRKEEYLQKKAEFRELCESKEKRKKQEEEEEIRKAKTEKQIWDYINKDRKKKTHCNNKINIEAWRKHF
ncbi:PREDICTED: uncharacterized protein LOC108573937 [Habropoda laboriosa]|uniref:uncharacterized protein LOC108573937 n=1 Tax=Habropoda laboriosa TaxID=597456 RepID=UPI00083DF532|nr:PREDICTED: uncharacterized protein LOC108573937 [Habropoda laboriosa]